MAVLHFIGINSVIPLQMVRNYKKQDKRVLWSEETMQLAVDAVRLGEPLKTVARRFHVPRNTLRRHAAGDAPVKKQLGHKTVLSTEQESKLKEAILDFENALYGLTRADTQDLVFQFCVVNNVPLTETLAKKTRELKKEKKITDCWTFNGKVLVKTIDGTVKEIRADIDLSGY